MKKKRKKEEQNFHITIERVNAPKEEMERRFGEAVRYVFFLLREISEKKRNNCKEGKKEKMTKNGNMNKVNGANLKISPIFQKVLY